MSESAELFDNSTRKTIRCNTVLCNYGPNQNDCAIARPRAGGTVLPVYPSWSIVTCRLDGYDRERAFIHGTPMHDTCKARLIAVELGGSPVYALLSMSHPGGNNRCN
jgi:hypothetical protein